MKKRKAWPPIPNEVLYAIQSPTLGCYGVFKNPASAVTWAGKHIVGDWQILIIKPLPYPIDET